ncbi:MAG: ABC-F family ATP-binding cassette domain-containing protein [Bacteroidales bacterium]|nr:ABC-F family ATP-binding cassette domain-containing protein [Bacteroidales bacterium]
MISIQGLSVEFSSKSLFSDISYVINKKDKIALVGKNGAGKSTMLKIIAGLQQPTRGIVAVQNNIVVGYLPQQMVLADTKTVRDDVSEAFNHITKLNDDIKKLNEELGERTDYESEDYHKLIDRLTHLTEISNYYNSENSEAEMEKTLMGLGFSRADFDRPTAEFSGGWRMRIELAKLLLRKPDVLLLDEPTNHLDIESIQWLENFLATKADAVMLVSHDRAFIDNVTNRTIEISCGKIYDYSVNYTRFEELRKERVEQQMRAYLNQQKEIKDIEDFIERFRYKPTKAIQVQSRIKQLEKIERIEVDEIDNSHINLKFPPAPRSGDYPIIAEDVRKQYGEHLVFQNATFTIKRGEKVAFVGKNGEGKSTLIKCIMNEIPYDGTLKLGHNVKIGYFAQNQAQLLDGEITVFDTIDHVAVGDIRTKIRDILGAFMFGGEASDKKVKVLSGGEKTRLAMIRLLLEPVNLLILDEPTNHLDMKTKDVLKAALKDFDGTIIVVSHDRDFLNGLVDKVYEFGGGKVREFLGGIYEFLDYKNMDSLRELEKKSELKLSNSPTKKLEEKQSFSGGKLSYAEQKEREKNIRKAEKLVLDFENKIAEIEKQIAEIEKTLASGESVGFDVYSKHAELQSQLEKTMSEWELACEEVEKIKVQ